MQAPSPPHPRRQTLVAAWLFVLSVLVFLMIVIGGATRLTESGLSIVEWKLVSGTIPPLNEADWQALFAEYRNSPQYRQINAGMSLEDFKGIFWLEFIHRLWGRMLGFAFVPPFAFFWWRGWLDRALLGRLALALILGAGQGVLGWLMVKSGLVNDPRVSHYRLAAHLGLGIAIYGYLFWLACSVSRVAGGGGGSAVVFGRARFLAALVFLTALSGALVAGLRAGMAYNTFPLMGGRLIPDDYLAYGATLANFFDNIAAVQFNHRVLATVTAAAAVLFGLNIRRIPAGSRLRVAVAVVPIAGLIQYGLGVATLLLQVPVSLGVLHQGMAVLLLTAVLWAACLARPGA
ncbi:MAG: heme A synthase [Alphaproteobacteria bacterium]|nr:heme A synthase [Alphaproteobacteria bacterium]